MAPTMMAQEPSNSNSLNHNVNVNNKAKEIGLAVTVEGIKVGPGGKMKQVSADGALSKNSSSSFSFGKDSNASVPAAPAPPSASEPTPPTAPTSASATLVPVQSPTSGTTTTLLIPPETAVRVIKGEIHNVLGQFRADQRYVSSARFTEEILGYHLDNTSSAGTSSAKDQHHQQQNHHQHQQQHHPVVQHFQDLHAALSEWEPQQHPNGQQQNGQQQNALDPMMYLPAFCAAVTGREISAPVTGAALSALHKFLLYGFLVPGSFHAVEGMSAIADALLNCTFEEDEKPAQVSPQRRTMNIQAGMMQGQVSNSVVPPGAGNSVLNMSGGAAANNSGGANNNIGNVRHLTATSSSSNSHSAFNVQHNDEQVVLKLLDLSALVVRCSLQGVNLIPARSVVGLLDTCLHVSHRASRASPLLKSAAVDALSQIVLQVFAGTGVPVMQARKEILRQLSALLNPAAHDESVTVSSLTAVNIALETCREPLQPDEIEIVQNDLCKYLLQWSTTGSQVILSLTLRVIFNLFSSIRNHLKVPLEVFLTSVHLRLCDTSSMSAVPPEHAEVALESLLEFCQEPALMQDLYLNYDCDVACTNLYETVVAALGKTAIPNGWDQALQESAASAAAAAASSSHGKNNTNGTANALVPSSAATTAGAGTATALVNKNSKTTSIKTTNGSNTPSAAASAIVVAGDNGQQALHPTAAANAPVNALQRLAAEGLLAILDSIAQRCQATSTAASSTTPPFSSRTSSMNESDTASNGELQQGLDWQSQESDLEVLHERKQKKHSLSKVAEAFNAEPMKKEWRALAASLDLLSNIDDPKQISHVLYTAPELDKVELGLYLSKGPEDKYPLEASVRTRFLEHFDFSNLTFAAALRKFLSKFRLPGEAQCIDRLMEAFSKELFQQQGESTFFKNADAVYVLAFSTIMLNTDLHNPTIKQEARMTLDQFIRNNRGINGGEDLPADYLTTLYEQIKDVQIQVRRELGEFMKKNEHGDIRATWEAVLSKSGEVATPFFTPASRARRNMSRAGVHDKEMFIVLSKWALKSLPGIFMRSWDDALVVKTLRGMKQMAKIAVFFDLDYIVDEILQVLLPRGRDYVINCVTWDHANNVDGGASVVSSANRTVQSIESMDDDERDLLDSDQPIPYDLLCTNESDNHDIDIAGSASNRGLLALDCSFVLLRKYAARATDAWPCFIECLCALRDARALPIGLSDLDDFADSNGNVLPLSSFAKKSQRRLDEHYRALSDQDADKKKSWFRSFFNKKEAKAREEDESLNGDDGSVAPNKGDISRYARILLAIAEAADVENVVQMGSTKLPAAEKTIISLLDTVDQYPFKKDPVQEQRAIFSLELAARALLSNRDRAPELFILFLNKFESILGRVTDKKVPSPFVIERIVVTILRCSIHLYDLPDLRPHLRASLHLITMVLPKSFMKHVADRMACGLAIILRASYHYFETPNEWAFLGDTLDMLANYTSARLFVFDGIASTVEYALPESNEEDEEGDRPAMSKDANEALARILTRFVLGFYQGDMTLTVPAMLCLEKVYRRKVVLLLEVQAAKQAAGTNDNDKNDTAVDAVANVDPISAAPDKDFWQNVAVAVYSVCRSSDPEVSRHGFECYQRIICRTAVGEIPDEKWIAIMYLMVNKQPPVVADISRGNTFAVLGQLVVAVVPELSHRPDNYDDLVDLIGQVAALARENLRHGRRGSVSPLFEKTLQTVTYLSNHMMTDEWKGEPEFSAWASETLLAELEKVGAAGASLKNQAAVKPSGRRHVDDNDDDDDDGDEEEDEDETGGDLSDEDDETETENDGV